MSIVTTTYTERKTVTTDDAGNVTITTSHAAHTSTEYLFSELSEEAKARAISDAIEEEQRDYYEYGIYGTSQSGMSEAEIWDAAETLASHQPVHIGTDAGGSPYGTARRYGWSVADWESVTEEQDTGICWSMDICDRWNEYARRIIALQQAHEEATEQADVFWSIVSDANWNKYDAETDAERERLEAIEHAAAEAAGEIDDMRDRIENAAEELTEEAARAVGNIVDGLIESEHDYYTSPEFWREWLNDGETRFTRDGERI